MRQKKSMMFCPNFRLQVDQQLTNDDKQFEIRGNWLAIDS